MYFEDLREKEIYYDLDGGEFMKLQRKKEDTAVFFNAVEGGAEVELEPDAIEEFIQVGDKVSDAPREFLIEVLQKVNQRPGDIGMSNEGIEISYLLELVKNDKL